MIKKVSFSLVYTSILSIIFFSAQAQENQITDQNIDQVEITSEDIPVEDNPIPADLGFFPGKYADPDALTPEVLELFKSITNENTDTTKNIDNTNLQNNDGNNVNQDKSVVSDIPRFIITRKAKAYDGDTIILDNKYYIRLDGIDAPEFQKQCNTNMMGVTFNCGKISFEYLSDILSRGEKLSCEVLMSIEHGAIGRCRFREHDLAQLIVRDGFAEIIPGYDYANKFVYEQSEAQSLRKGIWKFYQTE